MRQDKKSLAIYAVYAALVIGAIFAGYKLYSLLSAGKPGEAARAEGAPKGATLDLNEKQVASVKIEKVGTATFVPQRWAVGNIDFNQNLFVQVFPPYAGRIIEAYPNVGDKVAKDDILFTIDSPDLLNAENNVIANAGQLKLADVTLARTKKMKSFGGASQQDVDAAMATQQAAEAALKTARDQVRIFGKTDAEIDEIILKRKADPRLIIRSAINGHVTTRWAQPGLLVQPTPPTPGQFGTPGGSPPAYTVADLSTMWLFANVAETDAPMLRVGEDVKAHVAAYPEREFEGKVVVVGANVDPNSRRVYVRTEMADPEHLLRPGMLANFTVRVGDPKSAIGVPENAVVREGDGTMTAWVTEDRKHFTRRTLKVGMRQNGYAEILDGLRPGELLVTDNAVFLSNQYATSENPTD
jgi:cobalt-zinc-cadmium efflux system membrane fusion protein